MSNCAGNLRSVVWLSVGIPWLLKWSWAGLFPEHFGFLWRVESSWNMMAYGDAREGKWRGNWRMEWIASTLHTTLDHGVPSIITRSKRDITRAETRFGVSAKRTSPFKSAGVSVQSTAGSRGVQISGQQLYRPCSDVQCYPLHWHLSRSLPLPCVTVCHQVLNTLYYRWCAHLGCQ